MMKCLAKVSVKVERGLTFAFSTWPLIYLCTSIYACTDIKIT